MQGEAADLRVNFASVNQIFPGRHAPATPVPFGRYSRSNFVSTMDCGPVRSWGG